MTFLHNSRHARGSGLLHWSGPGPTWLLDVINTIIIIVIFIIIIVIFAVVAVVAVGMGAVQVPSCCTTSLLVLSLSALTHCRQGAMAYGQARYGTGSGPIWLDDLSCAGSERFLDMCSYRPWGQNNCQHSEDLGVSCGSQSMSFFLLFFHLSSLLSFSALG